MTGFEGFDLSSLISMIPVTNSFLERKERKWQVWYEPPMDCFDCGRPMTGPGQWEASNGLKQRSFDTWAEAMEWTAK